ncbi:response regulator [Sinirhodobacter sp. HNIBRBA609]|nr:response regulator [Sinirhodobacter sp. HNIBRBA609]
MSASIIEKLAQERRARLAAERLLEQKKRELFAANEKLSHHARALSDQIVQQRHGLERALTEAATLKGENSKVRFDLARATSLAQSAQRRLWDALETIRDGFALFDDDLRLVAANKAYLSFFRGNEAVSIGTTYDAVLRQIAENGLVELDGRDPQDWHRQMLARIRSPRIDPFVLTTPQGRHIRLIDRWGEDGDLVCLSQDITAMIRREAELEEARLRAEAANRAKSTFLANMSHEIRTPMNGVVGMAELLTETELTEEQRLYAETIRSSGEALLAIINDVLDYSKIEASRIKLRPEPFDLERCLHEIMVLLQPSAREKGVNLLVDYDLFLPTRFIADPGRMRQILMNLIGNAVKFTPSGHVLARVVGFEGEDAAYELHITVEDTGIGIAPEHVEHIFGEFNQVDSAANRKFEGTGLGLAITRQLIELMGGALWVDSELGAGACFGFRLSLPRAEPPNAANPPGPPIALRSALVIDPMLVNRAVVTRQLEACGLAVSASQDVEEALSLIEAGGRFDVILTDDAPSGSESSICQTLRARGVTAPILLVTAHRDAVTGDCFCARLDKPVLRAALYRELQALSSTRGAQNRTGQPPLRRMRILAAEDNLTNQLVFSKMVKDLTIEVHFANNGHEAVAQWRALRPDLIFMDISMPGMDGCDATRAIRAAETETGGHVPICALTAHAMEGDSDPLFAAGVDHYLTKPLKKGAIADLIHACQPEGTQPILPEEAVQA